MGANVAHRHKCGAQPNIHETQKYHTLKSELKIGSMVYSFVSATLSCQCTRDHFVHVLTQPMYSAHWLGTYTKWSRVYIWAGNLEVISCQVTCEEIIKVNRKGWGIRFIGCRRNEARSMPGIWWLFSPHGDAMAWTHFPYYWPFVRGIHQRAIIFCSTAFQCILSKLSTIKYYSSKVGLMIYIYAKLLTFKLNGIDCRVIHMIFLMLAAQYNGINTNKVYRWSGTQKIKPLGWCTFCLLFSPSP